MNNTKLFHFLFAIHARAMFPLICCLRISSKNRDQWIMNRNGSEGRRRKFVVVGPNEGEERRIFFISARRRAATTENNFN
jgi:hypothetical protein